MSRYLGSRRALLRYFLTLGPLAPATNTTGVAVDASFVLTVFTDSGNPIYPGTANQ